MIDCREAVRRMWPFLDRSLEPHPTEELETHLETCKRCGGELEFSREVRGMVTTTISPAMPDELRERVERLLATVRDGGQGRRRASMPGTLKDRKSTRLNSSHR